MLPHDVLAVGDERPDGGWRDAEQRDAVTLDHLPETVRSGVVWRAFEQHDRRAEGETARDQPWSHHPAKVTEPENDIVFLYVEAVGEIVYGLDREASVDVQRALRPAGGAGRVDDHVGIIGGGRRGDAVGRDGR